MIAAEEIFTGAQRVSNIIDDAEVFSLEEWRASLDGLVEKTADPGDGRRVRLKLTEAATRRLESLLPVQAPVNNALFASIGESEYAMLKDVMKRLVAHGDEALALLDFYITKTGTKSQG